MNYYKNTNIKCPYCNTEIILVEDIYYDENELKDVDYHFECINECDFDFSEMINYEDEITRIVTESLPIDIFCGVKKRKEVRNEKERSTTWKEYQNVVGQCRKTILQKMF